LKKRKKENIQVKQTNKKLDDDPMLIPLLECFASLVIAVGVHLGEYIKELYKR